MHTKKKQKPHKKCLLHPSGETLHAATHQCMLVLEALSIICGSLYFNYTVKISNSDSVKCVPVRFYLSKVVVQVINPKITDKKQYDTRSGFYYPNLYVNIYIIHFWFQLPSFKNQANRNKRTHNNITIKIVIIIVMPCYIICETRQGNKSEFL